MRDFWIFFLKKRAFTYLLLISLVAFGFYALIIIPKESAPEVRIPIGIVSTVLIGAGAEDVERLVTNKLEDGLVNLENLSKITSVSRESLSVITAEFTASADLDKSIQKLKDEVDKLRTELPEEAKEPVVSEVNFVDQPIMIIGVSGEIPAASFADLGEKVKNEIKTVAGVSKVQVSGVRDREVQVIVNKEALEQYGIRLTEVVSALSQANANLPVGSITLEGIRYNIKFRGQIEKPSEIGDIAMRGPSGNVVYIRDLAFISDGIEKATTFSRVSQKGAPSEPSLTLYVFKQSGGDITKVSREVREKLDSIKETTLKGMGVLVSFDQGDYVVQDLTRLTRTGFETTGLVILSLLITIGWRESLVAAISIPLSFLIAFIGLYYSGNTINFVSLFSLILAIGILVDSGIVVTEAINARLKKYGRKMDAAIASIKEYSWPLTAGTMTSIAAFVPLFFISGITGKFIASIPFTVIFVLGASLFVALGLVPLIAILFTKESHGNEFERRQEIYTEATKEWYKKTLRRILASRRFQNIFLWVIFATFFLSFALPITGILKVSFFPAGDVDFLYVELEKTEGSTLAQTDLSTRTVEEILYEDPDILSFITTVGQSSTFNLGTIDPKFANITINLRNIKERERTSLEILESLRQKAAPIASADVRVLQPDEGPPTGAPILIKFLGENQGNLDRVVEEAESILSAIPGTTEVQTSAKDNATQFAVTLDKAKASELGLSSIQVAQILRTAVEGTVATKLKTGGEDIDIVVKAALNPSYADSSETSVTGIDSIKNIPIAVGDGESVLLGSFITTSIEKESAVIRHEDGERVTTLSSQVRVGYNTREIMSEFLAQSEKLIMPEGVHMSVGGENEEVNKSFIEMFFALIAGMALMLAILVLEFNSFRYPLFLMVTVPLSLIGVFAGLTISGKAVSFPSILGFIALSGVIINHAIILLDSIIVRLRTGADTSLAEAVVESAAIRLRPIILTTITTVVGVIPLIYSSSLWGPIAFAIMFGLSFAIILTLVLVPILFYRWPGEIEKENGAQGNSQNGLIRYTSPQIGHSLPE